MSDELSVHLQDSIVYLTITNTKFARSVHGKLKPAYLYSKPVQFVFRVAQDYVKKFGHAIADDHDHFQDELLRKSKKLEPDKKQLVASYLSKLQEMSPPHQDFVMECLNDFIRSRALMGTTIEFAELVDKGRFTEAENLMYDALRAGIRSENIGIDYLRDYSTLMERGKGPERLMKFKIPIFDDAYNLCVELNDLVIIAGPQKGMKSWFGHYMGVRGVKSGLKVLHISLENRLAICEIRYDQMFGAMVRSSKSQKVTIRKRVEDDRIRRYKMVRPSVFNKKKVIKVRKAAQRFGGELRIRKLPMGSFSPVDLENMLDYLEHFEEFMPDLVICDYADIMAPVQVKSQNRDTINEIYMYLNRIADSKSLAIITMSQMNEEGFIHLMRTGSFHGRFLAEDKRKFANCDKGIYIGRTPAMEVKHEIVVGCFANRNGPSGQKCILGENLDIGQLMTYWREYEDETIEDLPRRRG